MFQRLERFLSRAPGPHAGEAAKVERSTEILPYRARISTSALFAASGLGMGGWASVIAVLQHRFALSHAALSVILLAFGTGAVSAMWYAPRLALRFGEDRTALVAASAFGCALALPALARSPTELTACVLGLGLANGILDVSMTAHASAVEQRWGRAIMSFFHGMFSLGAMIGSAAMSGLLALGLSLGASLGAFAAVILGGSAVCASVGLRHNLGEPALEIVGWATTRTSRRLITLAGLAFFALLIEGAIADWSGVLMTEMARVPAAQAGFAYASFAGAMVAGRLGGDHMVRWAGAKRVATLGGLVVAVAVALAIAIPRPWLICGCLAIAGFGMANIVPVLFSAAARETPEHTTQGVATATIGGYAGFLFGPPLIGFSADLSGLPHALVVLSAAALVISVGANQLLRPKLQTKSKPRAP